MTAGHTEVVISPCTIGGAAESAKCNDYFHTQNVTATLTVTPCWCYGTETMDLDPLTTKAIWGFNGTERPGAVYLAAAMAAHVQRGLPAFAIYGHDVQTADKDGITPDVEEKILRFARAALVVGQFKEMSYLSVHPVLKVSVCNDHLGRDYDNQALHYLKIHICTVLVIIIDSALYLQNLFL